MGWGNLSRQGGRCLEKDEMIFFVKRLLQRPRENKILFLSSTGRAGEGEWRGRRRPASRKAARAGMWSEQSETAILGGDTIRYDTEREREFVLNRRA